MNFAYFISENWSSTTCYNFLFGSIVKHQTANLKVTGSSLTSGDWNMYNFAEIFLNFSKSKYHMKSNVQTFSLHQLVFFLTCQGFELLGRNRSRTHSTLRYANFVYFLQKSNRWNGEPKVKVHCNFIFNAYIYIPRNKSYPHNPKFPWNQSCLRDLYLWHLFLTIIPII